MKIALYATGPVSVSDVVIGQFSHQPGLALIDGNELGFEEISELAQELTLPDADYAALLLVLPGESQDVYTLRALKHAGVRTPIVALTAAKSMTMRTNLLNAGALVALSATISGDELAAVLAAVARLQTDSKVAVVEAGDLTVNISLGIAYARSTQTHIHLTGKERGILEILAASKGRTLSKEAILTQLYGASPDDEPELKIIDVFICKLRKKISAALNDPDVGGKIITTVWGRGYRFQDPEEVAQVA